MYYMDEELYYHRIFLRPRREIVFPRVDDPKVQYGPLVIFVQEAIDFSLSTRFEVVEWPVPFDMVQLRIDFPDKIYFNTMIGRAICHFCTVHESFSFAIEGGFNVSDWLEQTPFRAMEYTAKFLEIVRKRTRPVNISIIYMLAFASHLVSEAVNSDKPELVEAACRSTVYMLQRAFPYEWIYWNTRLWSLTYNAVHKDLHQTWIPGRIDENLA
ncbi:hypothetical protein AVEN_35183-1 [Araneus ventricosus]|uniref:Uncharacterized protein n=1 Tax=Araneus ventricosus TaxID=182803 RepID=A0A4Y2WG15_ARAVE|nr:hypothetical protein AVEN_35183-1 [Araneus ventricosus]